MNTYREIYVEKLQSTDPRLKRQIRHDSKSKEYTFDTRGLTIVDVFHNRHIPILDQEDVGSCTGDAGVGDLATDPFIQNWPFILNQIKALEIYSKAQILDGNGPYPPNDYGSSGLSIAKVLKSMGLISGYQHTFSLTNALKAGSQYPFITGTMWYEDMFYPDQDGRVHPTGSKVGGHEYLCREIDAQRGRIWFDNSWGNSWGKNGRFYMTFEDYGKLLTDYGDVTILFPPNIAPPSPVIAFTKQLQYRMTDPDIILLQQRLYRENALDGIPCFRYHSVANPSFSHYFGINTMQAVQRYQMKQGIAKLGDSGYGRVGPLTLAALNK